MANVQILDCTLRDGGYINDFNFGCSTITDIIEKLGDAKIDIIEWNDDPAVLIENALSPSNVISVEVDEEEKSARVVVPDYQLSLAIGKEGQNARLAARLTGFKIDIKSETQARESGDFYDYDEDDDEYYEDDEYEESEESATEEISQDSEETAAGEESEETEDAVENEDEE